MNRMLILSALGMLLAGCQNSAWQNPYAAFGPTTVPSPAMQTAPQPGYYQPPPATPTTAPATATPTIRSEISATPAAIRAEENSFATRDGAATEEPVRIVEASPKPNSATASIPPAFSTALRQPAAPAPIAAAPTVKFNPAQFNPAAASPSAPAPALNRTRGFIPAAPASGTQPVPKNRLGTVPAIRRDPSVSPATYQQPAPTVIEAASNADGSWKAR